MAISSAIKVNDLRPLQRLEFKNLICDLKIVGALLSSFLRRRGFVLLSMTKNKHVLCKQVRCTEVFKIDLFSPPEEYMSFSIFNKNSD